MFMMSKIIQSVLIHLFLMQIIQYRQYYYHLHFTREGTQVLTVAQPSASKEAAAGFKPRQPGSRAQTLSHHAALLSQHLNPCFMEGSFLGIKNVVALSSILSFQPRSFKMIFFFMVIIYLNVIFNLKFLFLNSYSYFKKSVS